VQASAYRSPGERVATIAIRYMDQLHKLQISNGGTELVVNSEHKFDLSGGKKSILVDAQGNARESEQPIRVPAGPAWDPMRGPGAF
jgi:hypothetical protein